MNIKNDMDNINGGNFLVLECHRSYAVVLDERGRFLKVANIGYEVGENVGDVIEMEDGAGRFRFKKPVLLLFVVLCLCLVLFGIWRFWAMPFGAVRMQINPDVVMSVNRFGYVLELDGINDDGDELTDDVRVFGKKAEKLTEELALRAVTMGYLRYGDEIVLTVDGEEDKWAEEIAEVLERRLVSSLEGGAVITAELDDDLMDDYEDHELKNRDDDDDDHYDRDDDDDDYYDHDDDD